MYGKSVHSEGTYFHSKPNRKKRKGPKILSTDEMMELLEPKKKEKRKRNIEY